MTTVQEEIYLVPRISKSISKTELRVILMSVIQRMGYDLATDNQHGFYILSIARPWKHETGFHESNEERSNSMDTRTLQL